MSCGSRKTRDNQFHLYVARQIVKCTSVSEPIIIGDSDQEPDAEEEVQEDIMCYSVKISGSILCMTKGDEGTQILLVPVLTATEDKYY